MSQGPEDGDLELKYDFSGAVRGKYYQSYQGGPNVGRLREGEVPSPTGEIQADTDLPAAIPSG